MEIGSTHSEVRKYIFIGPWSIYSGSGLNMYCSHTGDNNQPVHCDYLSLMIPSQLSNHIKSNPANIKCEWCCRRMSCEVLINFSIWMTKGSMTMTIDNGNVCTLLHSSMSASRRLVRRTDWKGSKDYFVLIDLGLKLQFCAEASCEILTLLLGLYYDYILIVYHTMSALYSLWTWGLMSGSMGSCLAGLIRGLTLAWGIPGGPGAGPCDPGLRWWPGIGWPWPSYTRG